MKNKKKKHYGRLKYNVVAEFQSVFWGRARDKRNKGRVNHKMIYVHFFFKV